MEAPRQHPAVMGALEEDNVHDRLPPPVVAAIAAALAAYLDVEPSRLSFRLAGPTPDGRPDAGHYQEFGLIRLMGARQGGRAF